MKTNKKLEDGLDKIKMETYVHLLREAADMNFFKVNLKPLSNKLYDALTKVQSREDDAFPIAEPSFNKGNGGDGYLFHE